MLATWPPGYYVWRDRAPFILTLFYMLYLLKPNARHHYRHLTFWMLVAIVTVTSASLTFHLTGNNLKQLFGITWTYPAPIEWGTQILSAYTILRRRHIPGFEAMYLSVITALAGGWIYEIPRWINTGNLWGILNPNITKVFFIRYQIICIPIAAWVIRNRTQYKPPRYTAITLILYLAFNLAAAYTRLPRIMDRSIERSWCWFARVPTQFTTLYLLSGVGGPDDE